MHIGHILRSGLAGTAVAAFAGLALAATAMAADGPPSHKPANWSPDRTDCKALGLDREPPWTIGVSNFGLGNSWRVQMIEELKAAAKRDSRIKDLIVTNADGNLAKQLSDIEDLRVRDVDGLMVTAISTDGLNNLIEEAYDDGLATVIFDNHVSTPKFHGTVWADQYKFGWIGGHWLKEQLGGKGDIVMLDGTHGTNNSDQRSQGALDAMGPGINVLTRQPADWAYDKGKSVMEDLLSAYPKIDGIYSQGGAMSQGAIDALVAANRPLVPMPGEGYNGFLKTWAEHKDQGFSSVAPDDPTWSSVRALELLTSCLSGGTIDKWTELKMPVITDDTVDDYVRKDCPDNVWSNTKMSHDEITELYHCKK